MSDEIMLVFGEDGVAREYDDTWDITIHCESEEEQKAVLEKLKNSNQEAKTQLSREDTTLGVKKTCITCKHYPPESKWPCIDCDMRNPADRWEPQELSKNSPKLDKENGDLQPTYNQLATVAKDTNVPSNDCISRKAAIDALAKHEKSNGHNYTLFVDIVSECAEIIRDLPSAHPEPLTDKEQRIFLAAMGREEKVCEEVDRNYVRETYEDSLVRVCKEIRRKVKGALWI